MIIGQLLALFTAGCWAHNSIVYSIAGKKVSSLTTVHIRLWIAFPLIILLNFIIFHNFFPLGYPVQFYIYAFISGVIGFFLADMAIFQAFVDLGPRDTMLVLTTSPVFSAVISYFIFTERLPVKTILGISVTLIGIFSVIYFDHKNDKKNLTKEEHQNKTLIKIKGIALALMGSLGQSIGLVLSKKAMGEEFHPIPTNIIRMLGGLIGIVLFMIIRKKFIFDFKKMKDTKSLLFIAFGAVVGPVIGVIASLYALKLAPVGIVSTLMQSTPLLLVPVEFFLFKKKTGWKTIFGIFIALTGTALLFAA